MVADNSPNTDFFNLCNAQLMMWFDARVSNSSGYRLGGWLKTEQHFDASTLRKAMRVLAQSHEALRLRLDPDQPRQWIVKDCEAPLNVLEIQSDDPDAAFKAHLDQMFADPMPFGDSPLWRVDLLQISNISYVALSFHHIIVDTVSVQIALSHLLQAYLSILGGQTDIKLPTSSVRPLVESDLSYNTSQQFQADLTYWSERYSTVPPRLITAPTTPSEDPFATITFRNIPANIGFPAAAEAANLLPHRALFGILAVVLARRFGQTDLSCGLALHRRDRNSLNSVAMLAGLIPLRATFEDWWSLYDCVAAFDEHIDEDLRHNRLPLDALYREIGLTGKNARGLFDVTMSYVLGTGGFALPNGSTSSIIETREASPISFHATNDPKTGDFSYRLAVNPEYKGIVNAEALADSLDKTIADFSAGEWVDFTEVEALSFSEVKTLTTLATPTPLAIDDLDAALLPARIAAHASTTPNAPALAEASGAPISYA
ncbi:MAG: condensation domain-containing protein, partial [Paracoccaceae bacterium]